MTSPSVSDRPAIRTTDLWVEYRAIDPRQTLKGKLASLGRRNARKTNVVVHKRIQALRGVSVEVPFGSFVGVIGSNGSGKSTLLRAMAGILPPSKGKIEVVGTTTLLAIGLGFNRELTGEENIYLGGLAAGLSEEQIDERFDDIAAFADLGDFLYLPMKTYSSGMSGRLAFGVAVHVDPDILLIDEAMSAGDARFRERSYQKMKALQERAGAIVFVSHGLSAVRSLADHCIWLENGLVVKRGEPGDVIDAYNDFVKSGGSLELLRDDI